MTLLAKDLTVVRGERPLFRNVALNLDAGDVLRIEGRNGTGKTSLLRALSGLSRPFQGSITWQGESIHAPESTYRDELLYVGHDLALKFGQTVQQNLLPWARLYGARKPGEAVMTALAAFNVDSLFDVPAGYLSSGQKRRVALSRLLLVPRTVWLLDEPSVGLDSASVSRLEVAIQNHRSGGGIVVTSTHTRLTLLNASLLDLDHHQPVITKPALKDRRAPVASASAGPNKRGDAK